MAARARSARPASVAGPERWHVVTHGEDLAQLDIPAHASRERTFEIDCSFLVARHDADEGTSRHGLRVLVDGAQQWSRWVATAFGPSDSLDVRIRHTVPVGSPLRITAVGGVEGTVPLRLTISADED